MTAKEKVKAHTDAWFKAGGFLSMRGAWARQHLKLINDLWPQLVAEDPKGFFEKRKKTTDIGLSQFGKLVQKVKVKRLAMAYLATEPTEDLEIFVPVATLEEWIPVETVQVPSVVSVPEGAELEDCLEAAIGEEQA